MAGGEDVAPAVPNLLVARELHDDLVDAEVVRALAEEGEDLVSTSAECRDAFKRSVYVGRDP